MIQRLAQTLLTLAVLASAVVTLRAGLTIWNDPGLRPLREATAAEISASIDRQLALEATPDRLAARIEARLTEEPRNWLALDALTGLAEDRAIALPPDLAERLEAARQMDFSALALAGDCAACFVDIAQCSLTTALLCKAPILLTPIEDLRGLAQAGVDYTTGAEVDQIDLGLSVLGLSASGLALASGGGTLPVKAGAAMAKLARGMNLLSPRLIEMAGRTIRQGIDWAALPGVRSGDDLAAAVRADVAAPLMDTLADLGRISETLGPSATLHLLPLVDDATDAARLARATTALGPRSLAAVEMLGKSRLLRATLRMTDLAASLLVGMAALGASVASLISSAIAGRALRHAQRRLG